ncbi:hypothetical protein [Nostoc sp. LPT]|uniref:hypothetical protein n=1 Tax=Nostoc sp. LPT TaxID=2815387 RepID=UPI001D8CE3A4|nr:hypothetical protein [Nostoc sp. LPT]MBN4006119.1 hypothetical protein [Nostoc sp. LPT]
MKKQGITTLPIASLLEQVDRLEMLMRRLLYFDQAPLGLVWGIGWNIQPQQPSGHKPRLFRTIALVGVTSLD